MSHADWAILIWLHGLIFYFIFYFFSSQSSQLLRYNVVNCITNFVYESAIDVLTKNYLPLPRRPSSSSLFHTPPPESHRLLPFPPPNSTATESLICDSPLQFEARDWKFHSEGIFFASRIVSPRNGQGYKGSWTWWTWGLFPLSHYLFCSSWFSIRPLSILLGLDLCEFCMY